jgi:hypothetical protein
MMALQKLPTVYSGGTTMRFGQKRLGVATLLLFVSTAGVGGTLAAANSAEADPLTPAEAAFLKDVHDNVPPTGETDAQLLSDGWYACHNQAIGVDITAMGVKPLVAQLALAELCPHGCPPPDGCQHF